MLKTWMFRVLCGISVLIILLPFIGGQVNTIIRYAGGGTNSAAGNIPLTQAKFNSTYNLWIRTSTNMIYIVDTGNNRIRNFDSGTGVTFYAGSTSGVAGYADHTTPTLGIMLCSRLFTVCRISNFIFQHYSFISRSPRHLRRCNLRLNNP